MCPLGCDGNKFSVIGIVSGIGVALRNVLGDLIGARRRPSPTSQLALDSLPIVDNLMNTYTPNDFMEGNDDT
jgi:hypothetical protein